MGAEGMHVFWKHTCSMLPLYTNKHMQSQTFSGPELRFRRQGSELASRATARFVRVRERERQIYIQTQRKRERREREERERERERERKK